MTYVGIFAIDSWHLNGRHFPSISTTRVYDNANDCIMALMHRITDYYVEDANHKRITQKDVEEAIKESKYGVATIHFEYPREGQITVVHNNI